MTLLLGHEYSLVEFSCHFSGKLSPLGWRMKAMPESPIASLFPESQQTWQVHLNQLESLQQVNLVHKMWTPYKILINYIILYKYSTLCPDLLAWKISALFIRLWDSSNPQWNFTENIFWTNIIKKTTFRKVCLIIPNIKCNKIGKIGSVFKLYQHKKQLSLKSSYLCNKFK